MEEIERQETEEKNTRMIITIYEIMNLCYEKLKMSDEGIKV